MAAPGVARPTRLEVVRADAAHVLGSRAAARVEAFPDGTLHVRAGELRRALAWLVDFAVYLLLVGVGLVALTVPHGSGKIDDGGFALGAVAVLLLAAPLYGLCYGNGRALGAVVTGTRLVRLSTGGRIGFPAPWAMTVRTVLLPLLIASFVVGALASGSPPGSPSRTSIDDRSTRRLRAAGFRTLADRRVP
ncbi:RDD family protein [Saccharothrix saharensis]|uniref:RDD family protein n=1 Tax=Saccharothrix saharensis TaxID=571190 RepID=A0A543J7Q6_9PSEU|nr:RDD family protein [Saccharothrix saharensis]TQM78851.1 RDD family protein [Saccharothrix saharensis]